MENIKDVIEPVILAVTVYSGSRYSALLQGETAGEDGQLLQNHIW